MTDKPRRTLPIVLCVIAAIVVAGRLLFGGSDDGSLTSPDPHKRLIALETLWQQDSNAARAKLRAMAEDPDPRVIAQSIRGMGFNRDEGNRRQLLVFAGADREPAYRREALAALGRYEDVNVSQFTAVLQQDRDPQARAGAAQALARRADKSTIPALYRALSDPDAEVRVWAITGIKNITFTGFIYEASLPPQEQRVVIEQIGAFLRRNGFM